MVHNTVIDLIDFTALLSTNTDKFVSIIIIVIIFTQETNITRSVFRLFLQNIKTQSIYNGLYSVNAVFTYSFGVLRMLGVLFRDPDLGSNPQTSLGQSHLHCSARAYGTRPVHTFENGCSLIGAPQEVMFSCLVHKSVTFHTGLKAGLANLLSFFFHFLL